MNSKDPHIGYATCSTIAGEYKFHGPLLYEGKPIRRWDMGTYQDADGTGYLLLHGGIVYRLSKDYRTARKKWYREWAVLTESLRQCLKKTVHISSCSPI